MRVPWDSARCIIPVRPSFCSDFNRRRALQPLLHRSQYSLHSGNAKNQSFSAESAGLARNAAAAWLHDFSAHGPVQIKSSPGWKQQHSRHFCRMSCRISALVVTATCLFPTAIRPEFRHLERVAPAWPRPSTRGETSLAKERASLVLARHMV